MSEIIVLIPHYNNTFKLIQSIQSIKEQITVDLLIVDDGSQDDLLIEEDVKKAYQYGKVFIEKLHKNKGIEHALNRGLELIQKMNYKYIGRLDCGDFCHTNRFSKQLDFLKSNPNIYLLGTWANVLDLNGKLLFILKHPHLDQIIKKRMYLNSMFVHPSVVFRSSIIENVGFYPTNYKAAEDYAYFFKIIEQFEVANLPEALLDYIIDDDSISSTKRKLQVKNRIKVILNNFYFGFYPIYGLLRNVLLLVLSRKVTTSIKKILTNNV